MRFRHGLLGHTFSYDGENRPYLAGGVNYYYDGESERVAKSNGKLYWFGTNSAPVLETDTSGNTPTEYGFFNGKRVAMRKSDGSVHYYFADQVGSADVVTNATGAMPPEQDIESHPYGEQQVYTDTLGQEYRFTGKERDAESGLDYFTARYFGSSLGRFMSPDPMGGHPEDPQTLNRYAYVRNNPTTLTDPTGLDFYLRCSGGDTSTCQGGHVGTTDDKGKFTATVVTSDSIREGKNSASVDQNGVEVTTDGKTYSGQYFDNPASHTTDAKGNDVNHNPVDLKGSGQFVGFSFNINGNCSGTCLASGSFSFNAPRDFTGNVLQLRGSFRSIVDRRIPGWGKSLDEWEFHPGTEQYRFGTGPSPHFSLPDNPKDTVPTVGPFHVDKDAPGIQHLGCAKLGVGCQ